MADGADPIKTLEARIKELENEKLLKPLESRIQNIERILWVLGALAIIFGASGGWGLSALLTARSQLADFQKGAQGLQDARIAAVKAVSDEKTTQLTAFSQQAGGIAHQAVEEELKGQISEVAKFVGFPYHLAATPQSQNDPQHYVQELAKVNAAEIKSLGPFEK